MKAAITYKDRIPFFEDHHYEIRELVQGYAAEKVAPRAREIDETKRFPHETVAEMKELGLLGVPFPEEWGGAGLDYLAYVIVIEELARACGTTGAAGMFHVGTSAQEPWISRPRWTVCLPKARQPGANSTSATRARKKS